MATYMSREMSSSHPHDGEVCRSTLSSGGGCMGEQLDAIEGG